MIRLIIFGAAIAVCAWAYLEGCRRRSPITRLGRLLHIACLLTMLGWHHMRHAIRNAWHLAGGVACWLLLMLVMACGALGTALMDAARQWRYGDSAEVGAALRRHPSYPLDADLAAWDAEYHADFPRESERRWVLVATMPASPMNVPSGAVAGEGPAPEGTHERPAGGEVWPPSSPPAGLQGDAGAPGWFGGAVAGGLPHRSNPPSREGGR